LNRWIDYEIGCSVRSESKVAFVVPFRQAKISAKVGSETVGGAGIWRFGPAEL
jgi:hypothetical protein